MTDKENSTDKGPYSLIGTDGNAFAVMGYVNTAMRQTGMSEKEIEKYDNDAMSGDYHHLLKVSFDMISVCNKLAKLKNSDEQ